MIAKDINRTITESTVNLNLKFYETDPYRSLRRLMDTGRRLSRSPLQREILTKINSFFDDDASNYHEALKRFISSFGKERTIHFGINLGFTAWTRGVHRIRLHEKFTRPFCCDKFFCCCDKAPTKKESGNVVPWLMEFSISKTNADKFDDELFLKLLDYLTRCGTSAFVFKLQDASPEILSTLVSGVSAAAKIYNDYDFLIILPDTVPEDSVVNKLSGSSNIMLSIPQNASSRNLMEEWFLEKEILFCYHLDISGFTPDDLTDADDSALSGIMTDIADTASPIIILIDSADRSEEEASTIDTTLGNIRNKQKSPVFLINYDHDIQRINKLISNRAVPIEFSANVSEDN